MARFELIMPKMGESIMEATILKWMKQIGDHVEVDETVLEIATDKVDSEVPSPVKGTIEDLLFEENDVVPIGKAIAIIKTSATVDPEDKLPPTITDHSAAEPTTETTHSIPVSLQKETKTSAVLTPTRFYSPLVKNIAKRENIELEELEQIPGSGLNGRVTKSDILAYLEKRPTTGIGIQQPLVQRQSTPSFSAANAGIQESTNGNVEIIEMDRMRKLIADHMVHSKHTSPHVTSFVEVDVTDIVQWRNSVKKSFFEQHQEKITFTPIFIEAVVKAIKDFPMVNISLDGHRIIKKKSINIGMATALPTGNLIVPVIKNADQLSLLGTTKAVNDLARRARESNLKPHEIQGGTFTVTNVGTFGNVMGTPIINQPQVAILAIGAIRKKPAVVETAYGDLIAVRQMMFLSLSYDHRVVDGFLGGSFLRRIGDYLEQFDPNRTI